MTQDAAILIEHEDGVLIITINREDARNAINPDLIHIGSIAGELAYPAYAVYNATKGAIHRLTANLRVEFGPRGLRVHTIQPGLVSTELGSNMGDLEQQAGLEQMLESIRPLDARDIADAIVYVAGAPTHVNIADMVVVATQQT